MDTYEVSEDNDDDEDNEDNDDDRDDDDDDTAVVVLSDEPTSLVGSESASSVIEALEALRTAKSNGDALVGEGEKIQGSSWFLDWFQ
jgi:hypothetical protein